MKHKIEDLIAHLKTYKDAVVIVGPYATESYELFEITEKTKDIFNRKTLVREPEKFWQWYKESIFKGRLDTNKELTALIALYGTGVIKNIITTTHEGVLDDISVIGEDVIPLMGSQRFLTCVKCHSKYCMSFSNGVERNRCECGSRLKPSVLMFNEDLPYKEYQDTKKALFIEEEGEVKLNTHTLICIGVDFDDQAINELVNSYRALMNKCDKDYLVLINNKDTLSIEELKPEFATQKDIANSIERLVNLIEEE